MNMENNNQKKDINQLISSALNTEFIELEKKQNFSKKSQCQKCTKKNKNINEPFRFPTYTDFADTNKKKDCKFCQKSKIKFSWLFFWCIYLLIFIVWGHIELFKLLKSWF